LEKIGRPMPGLRGVTWLSGEVYSGVESNKSSGGTHQGRTVRCMAAETMEWSRRRRDHAG
jgi:hypothetical protein